ncbi:MAG: hypothetical protein AAFY76_27090 [Cyanobacteria bacterium J06649_11]
MFGRIYRFVHESIRGVIQQANSLQNSSGLDVINLQQSNGQWIVDFKNTPAATGFVYGDTFEELTQEIQTPYSLGYGVIDTGYSDGIYYAAMGKMPDPVSGTYGSTLDFIEYNSQQGDW